MIGVILMVAITVAIAAVVYVWVTSFGGGGTPAPSMSISQDASASSGGWANFTVVSASPNAKWGDLNITITGFNNYSRIKIYSKAESGWFGTNEFSNAGAVSAGDRICINVTGYDVVGETLRIIHVPSNSIIVTWTIY